MSMPDDQTEAATGAAILKEMVDVANSAAFWVQTPSANVKAVAAYVDHLQSDLESSILAHRAWPVQIEQLRAENKAMREQVAQADREHDETVKMMREMIAERDNEIACLTALQGKAKP